jgi:hypothetical protein
MARISFDWLAFCTKYKIDFIRHGKNVSGNNIAVKCPLCGDEDPSQHLTLSLDVNNPAWFCWRNARHRGRNPTFLISRLGRMSLIAARNLVQSGIGVMDDEWSHVVERLINGPVRQTRSSIKAVPLPQYVTRLTDKTTNRPFLSYLEKRGFDRPWQLVRDVELYCSFFSRFSYRLIFPVYHDGKLVNLIGRDITGKQHLRYKTLANEAAGLPIDQTVYNYDDASFGGEVLWICEGPVDALKLNWYGAKEDSAIALFGMPKNHQLAILNWLGRWYDACAVVLDADAMSKALWLRDQLMGSVVVSWLPAGVKDVGGMTGVEVEKFCRTQKRVLTMGTHPPKSGRAGTHTGV